jgi:Domain of unknown function (DUF4253)
MTAQMVLPPMRSLGSVQISRRTYQQHSSYDQLLTHAAATGHCPVWVTDDGVPSLQVSRDPAAAVAAIDRLDPGELLARQWPRNCPLCGCRSPSGDRFTGLAPAPELVEDPVTAAIGCAAEPWPAHLAVVPVSRPADIVAAVGWLGTGNYHDDVAGLSAVLRSWEERFGALLVRMDQATLWLSVAGPPRSEGECRAVAAEHFAFCPDVDGEDPRPLREYAASLAGRRWWRLWWD